MTAGDCALEHTLGLMLCWMFDIERADDESVALANDGLLTGGGVASSRKKPKAGRVLSFDAYIVDGPARIDLEEGREIRVHPWLRPRAGVGHAFEKDECRQLGCRRAEFSGEGGMGRSEPSRAAGMSGSWREWPRARPGF